MQLISGSVGQASPEFVNSLQLRLNECEKHRSRNRSVPLDEDLASFPDIIKMTTSSAEIDACIRPILEG